MPVQNGADVAVHFPPIAPKGNPVAVDKGSQELVGDATIIPKLGTAVVPQCISTGKVVLSSGEIEDEVGGHLDEL